MPALKRLQQVFLVLLLKGCRCIQVVIVVLAKNGDQFQVFFTLIVKLCLLLIYKISKRFYWYFEVLDQFYKRYPWFNVVLMSICFIAMCRAKSVSTTNKFFFYHQTWSMTEKDAKIDMCPVHMGCFILHLYVFNLIIFYPF